MVDVARGMTMTDWSLEKELCALTGASSLEESLVTMGILNRRGESFTISKDDEWARGGAETYLYRFQVASERQTSMSYIIKACVAFSLDRSLDGILSDWVERRKLLADHGVSTPVLLAYGKGVLVEEFVPYSLEEILVHSSSIDTILRRRLLCGMAFLAGIVSMLGFTSIDPFSDLRSRGDDIVAIDFGEDLGPPNVSNSRTDMRLYERLLQLLARYGVDLQHSDRSLLLTTFKASCSFGGRLVT